MKLAEKIPNNSEIRKPNLLIEASYILPSISAVRMEMLAFTKLDTKHYITDEKVKIKITAKEYMKHWSIDQKNIYKVMKESAENMLKTKVLFKGAEERVPILDKYEYIKGDVILHYNEIFLKCCILPLDNPLTPYLMPFNVVD